MIKNYWLKYHNYLQKSALYFDTDCVWIVYEMITKCNVTYYICIYSVAYLTYISDNTDIIIVK